MKVVDIQPYRLRREIRTLESRVGILVSKSFIGSTKEMKTCFKEWLNRAKG